MTQYTTRAWIGGKLVSQGYGADLAMQVRILNALIENAPRWYGAPVVGWEIEGKTS